MTIAQAKELRKRHDEAREAWIADKSDPKARSAYRYILWEMERELDKLVDIEGNAIHDYLNSDGKAKAAASRKLNAAHRKFVIINEGI